MRHLAIGIACFFAAAAARGDVSLPRYGNEADCGYCAALEIDRLAALLGDPILRDLVCRLGFESYTPGTLSKALRIPRDQVMRRIDTLRGWGLVRAVSRNSAPMIVEPLPGAGADTLRRWALRYCPAGDACGAPGGDVEVRKDMSSSAAGPSSGGSPTSEESDDSRKLIVALARIDAINSDDPQKVVRDGKEQARELLASQRRSFWLDKLSPQADPLLQIVTRGQHIARWERPRSRYPKGKVGYTEWRKAQARFHALRTADILADLGYSKEQMDRVKILIQKKALESDPATPLLRDVSILVFLEYEFDKLTATQSKKHRLHTLTRTWRNLSAKGRESVRGLNMSSSSMELVDTVLKDEGEVKY